ncbi:MAG TPA: hypothetical protein VHP35_11110, partial [Terriglobia bacterium]|nr:hypothetical protein [Terriglobia bacterium]
LPVLCRHPGSKITVAWHRPRYLRPTLQQKSKFKSSQALPGVFPFFSFVELLLPGAPRAAAARLRKEFFDLFDNA